LLLVQHARQIEAVAIGQAHVQQRQFESALSDRAPRGEHRVGARHLVA
jgi:hypothetical protein